MSLFTKHYVKHKLPPKQEKQPYDIKLVIIATTVFVILKASVFLHRNQGDLWVWRIIYTMWFTIMFLWVEAHCRGHKLSARYSTNHLGEGLRQEPIVTLAGCHLIQVSKWTENMALWEQLSHEKLHGAVGQRHSVDVALWLGTACGWRMSAMYEVGHSSRTQFRLLSSHTFCVCKISLLPALGCVSYPLPSVPFLDNIKQASATNLF